jgi:HD-GYP domain-containing protein (c-di-GMP phosphodiesterase class II)
LRKAALLNPDEYEEMKQHPVIGANIVSHLPNVKRFISGIKYHHEKWDGSGYPDGLVGENIPFFGRIVAVADVFDAMVSGRSYSGFLDEGDAVQRLSEEKDIFDSDVVRAFGQAWQSGRLTQKTSTQKNSVKKTDEDT